MSLESHESAFRAAPSALLVGSSPAEGGGIVT
jgi:hypothetical protein